LRRPLAQFLILMPRISYFYGIAIRIHYQEHPPPHFHAVYGDEVGQIEIQTGRLIEGRLPRRVLALVQEWRKLHIDELMEDWDLAQAHLRLKSIEPLK
jgi:hypothetical protein